MNGATCILMDSLTTRLLGDGIPASSRKIGKFRSMVSGKVYFKVFVIILIAGHRSR